MIIINSPIQIIMHSIEKAVTGQEGTVTVHYLLNYATNIVDLCLLKSNILCILRGFPNFK